jgi:cysteine synthase
LTGSNKLPAKSSPHQERNQTSRDFDKCWELRKSGEDLVIFNQFDEFGNYLWHYEITGHAMQEVLEKELRPGDQYRGVALTTGSAGTIASGDFLKKLYPTSKIIASEALQCPTLLNNGFGAHRIEGIGDKHVPGFTMSKTLTCWLRSMIMLWWN